MKDGVWIHVHSCPLWGDVDRVSMCKYRRILVRTFCLASSERTVNGRGGITKSDWLVSSRGGRLSVFGFPRKQHDPKTLDP
jgi:hypothetical protein